MTPNWSIWWEWRSDAKWHIICCVNWRTYIDTRGKKLVLMNLNGNGKMDSILNILVHWKMLFWVRLAITSIWSIWKYPKSTKWLFFWGHILWTLIDFILSSHDLATIVEYSLQVRKVIWVHHENMVLLTTNILKNGMFVPYRSISIWWSPIESWYGILSLIKKLAQI